MKSKLPIALAGIAIAAAIYFLFFNVTDAEIIADQIERDFAALDGKDIRPFMNHATPGFVLTRGGKPYSRSALEALADQHFAGLRGLSVNTEPDVRVEGDRANVIVRVTLNHPSLPGNSGKWPMVIFITLERSPDGWRYVAGRTEPPTYYRRTTDAP